MQEVIKLLAVLSTESIWMGVSKMDVERQKQFYRSKEMFKKDLCDHYPLVMIYEAWRKKL